MEDLPSLNEGRWSHGCAGYRSEDDDLVSLLSVGSWTFCITQWFRFQVMLVTGGWDIIDMKTHKTKRFDSTELLAPGARSWRVVGALPMPMSGMHHSLATLNNQVFLFGEKAL